jgi:hypothetical protein
MQQNGLTEMEIARTERGLLPGLHLKGRSCETATMSPPSKDSFGPRVRCLDPIAFILIGAAFSNGIVKNTNQFSGPSP